MIIKIDGKNITKDSIDKWRLVRIKKALRTIKKKMYVTDNADEMIAKLADIKLKFSYEQMYSLLKKKLHLTSKVMKIGVKLSSKTKFARTEISIEGISTSDVALLLDKLMLKATPEHNKANLTACPEHYVLRPIDENSLEVIETCGNAPMPFQFFIKFGDNTDIKTPHDSSFQYQSIGTAYLKDGTPIGGVRHQFKDIENGVLAKLCVEFPSLTPNTIIKAHQMHLASEFSYWLQWIKDHAQ
ncbi:hypothetical protein LJB89_01680 [Tyzzerella sp. OttesenSCG-928-J15]|nr:hypothetical protein [Tyzzerella sp. OttesenSCG-928-J15]